MPTPEGSSRDLTPGEITLARLIFRNGIDYSKVKIHHGKYMFFQAHNVAMSPNGNIYFPKGLFIEDFSAGNVRDQQLFIHEMTHVWQHQLGYPVTAEGLSSWIKANYQYKLDTKKKFSDYGMEAQANILGDFFILERHGEAASHLLIQKDYQNKTGIHSLYKSVLKDFISNSGDRSNLPSKFSSKNNDFPF